MKTYKSIKLLMISILLVPISGLAEVKLRYPLDSWSTAPFWTSTIIIGPQGETYSAPENTAITSYFDHDAHGNSTATNYKCQTEFPYDKHDGVDFRLGLLSTANPSLFNTQVHAAAPGKVIQKETSCDPIGGYWNNGCGVGLGNHMVLEHDVVTRTVDRYFGGHFTV